MIELKSRKENLIAQGEFKNKSQHDALVAHALMQAIREGAGTMGEDNAAFFLHRAAEILSEDFGVSDKTPTTPGALAENSND